ncbi:MAG: enoyl-CoA hydratase/isomerase family protein [Candidatus Eremiobacteraeota bacterium]|nr:enoyl-CoA hydratase/isomerase family protein [Candidatus Eremiobacteraeota bacterium]
MPAGSTTLPPTQPRSLRRRRTWGKRTTLESRGHLVVQRTGATARLVLNRPAALNAVTRAMFETIATSLLAWRDDADVRLVLVSGTGKAFSAGGDIREVRTAVLEGAVDRNEALYRAEYGGNALVSEYPKPYVALVDGICMGGGLGLAVHGSHRVVTERALIAMPETAIGFFPDVGCTYLLPRIPGALGIFAGLTGYRMTAAEAIAAGLADAFVPSQTLAALERDIIAAPGDVDRHVRQHRRTPQPASVAAHRDAIARTFGQPSVAAIVASLEREGSEWARDTLATLRRMSPSALVAAFALFRHGAQLSLREALAMELHAALAMTQRADFLEGVRAMVIDKDRRPAWRPASLEDVDVAEIERLADRAARAGRAAPLQPPAT